jgi:AraC-like DNA-binding protein
MRICLTDPDDDHILYEKQWADNYATGGAVEQSEIRIIHPVGTASMADTWFDGIHISHGQIHLTDTLTFKAECDTPVIEMHFGLSGSSEAVLPLQSQMIRFAGGEHNICYTPESEGMVRHEKQPTAYQMFEIHVTESYFNRFQNAQNTMLDRFLENIGKKKAATIGDGNRKITPVMHKLVSDMKHCQRTGVMKRLFLEARVMELIILQFEQFDMAGKSVEKKSVKPADVEKLHHVKAIIENNIHAPHSLAELSKAVGLNDFKLKKGFKSLFGNTVFGYLHEIRMQEAQRLLRDTTKTIQDISEFCGYAYVQHFTTAFRSKFGVTPATVRAL